MNESLYMQNVWKGIRKAGEKGKKYLDTGWLDSAFGGAEARRNLQLEQIGNARDYRQGMINLQNQRLDLTRSNLGRESKDALVGDVITAGSLPLSYLEGMNARKENQANIDRQKKLNRMYDMMIGKMS